MERLVLEQLQPSTNLKKLTIHFYGGTTFPNWLGDPSFGNMTCLRISGCDHCWSLPPLGQLLCLKELIISGLKSIKTVGSEFYGSSSPSFHPFPSLEILSFEEMPDWEEWELIGEDASQSLSFLQSLSICACPNLESFPLGGLATPNLNHFLAFAQDSLPVNLRILEVSKCGSLSATAIIKWGLQWLTCLAKLRIRVLTIKRYQLLEASCQSNGGKEWPKIAHISCIIINNKSPNIGSSIMNLYRKLQSPFKAIPKVVPEVYALAGYPVPSDRLLSSYSFIEEQKAMQTKMYWPKPPSICCSMLPTKQGCGQAYCYGNDFIKGKAIITPQNLYADLFVDVGNKFMIQI
ncbi:Leucine-rich repeat domain superfamily [Sesbania bispinosa]|nr:Leucine-rich repeat domain superfamily [Sesbania bispinosa]